MSLISDIIGSNQTSKAVNAQVDSLQTGINGINGAVGSAQSGVTGAVGGANDLLKTGYDAQTQALAPYLQAGSQGVTSLAQAFAPGGSLAQNFSYSPTDLQNDPGYQFQLQQGDQAINRNASAKGQSLGGGTLAALQQYGQGLAGTTYNNAYNRALNTFQTNRNNQFQGLSSLAGIGQGAVGQFGQETGQYAQGAGQNLIGGATYNGNIGLAGAEQTAKLNSDIGQARAGGSLAQGKIWGGYFNQLGSSPAAAALFA